MITLPVFLYPHIDRNNHALKAPRQRQRALDRNSPVRRPVFVGLGVVRVRPEGKSVLNIIPGLNAAHRSPAPRSRGQDAALRIPDQDRGFSGNRVQIEAGAERAINQFTIMNTNTLELNQGMNAVMELDLDAMENVTGGLDDKTKAAAHGLTVATGAITGGVIGAAAGPVGIAVGAAVGGAVRGIGALIVWLRERNK